MWFSESHLSDLFGGSPEFEVQQTEVRDGMPREIMLEPETCALCRVQFSTTCFLCWQIEKRGILFLFSLWWVIAVFSPRAVVSLCSLGQLYVVQSGFTFVLNSCLAFCVVSYRCAPSFLTTCCPVISITPCWHKCHYVYNLYCFCWNAHVLLFLYILDYSWISEILFMGLLFTIWHSR